MKSRFTCLILALAFSLLSTLSYAQTTGDYRSAVASGNWVSAGSWERYDGASWVPAVTAPSNTDGVITILNGHNITISTGVTADQIVVDAGGTISANAGQTLTLNNGSGDDLVIAGTVICGANTPLAGPGTTVVQSGGNLTMNALSGSTFISSPVTVDAGGVVDLSGGANKVFNADFVNNGTFNWGTGATSGGIQIGNVGTPTFTNNGTLNEQFSSNRGFLSTTTGSFVNNGTVNKTTTFTFFGLTTIVNNGVFNVATGLLNPALGSFTNSATGALSGNGTIQVSGGTFVNDGQIRPGSSPGTLTVNPATLQGTNTDVFIEILDGSGGGTGHDSLRVTGNTNLDGVTITVREIAPGNTAPLGVYTILSTSGTFSGTPTMDVTSNYTVLTTFPATGNTIQVQKIALIPLPVNWGGFTALASDNNTVKLNWTTLQESNVSHFVVEFSRNGRDFESIATVTANGNTSTTSYYSFVHNAPDVQKANYYRIKQVDFDNKESASAIQFVKFRNGTVVPITITPNPVRDDLRINVQVQNLKYTLLDLSGRIMSSGLLQQGTNTINMAELSAGIYNIAVYEEGRLLETHKVVKQ